LKIGIESTTSSIASSPAWPHQKTLLRTELAALNLTADKRAKAASAYADAKTCVKVGLELLGSDRWRDQYELTLSLQTENGEADLVCDLDGVALRITDDGRSFDVEKLPAGHDGLDIISERA